MAKQQTHSRIAHFATLAVYLMVALIMASGLLAGLPSKWIGHPYLRLVEWLNPGIDAPDNWAMAFIYFVRTIAALAIGAAISAIVIVWCKRSSGSHRSSF